MPRKLDPKIGEVLKQHGFGPDAVWDCHGVWVIYHKVLEQIAAKSGIRFDQPFVVEADGKEGIAAICVTGSLGDKCEWSIGEAAPKNNKNAYPWAMAEKRAKDRVILKLIGLHGYAYSEDEADDFRPRNGNGRDITHGVGTDPAPKPEFTLYYPWGEEEEIFAEPVAYLNAVTDKVRDQGGYWQSNREGVERVGRLFAEDKKLRDHARQVWKLGEDAWRQCPENPANKKGAA